MLLLEKRRKGRELDSLARKFSRVVLKFLTQPDNIKSLESGEVVQDYIDLKPLGLAQPNLIGIELEIDSNLDINAIGGSGSFQMVPGEPEISYISVTISLPKPFTRRHLERFYEELIEIMRHEIEHSAQDPDRIEDIAEFADDPFASKQNMLDYFTSPEETSAHVAGWMKIAKRSREPIEKVIRQQVEYIKQQAEHEGMSATESQSAADQILKQFVRHAMDRYKR